MQILQVLKKLRKDILIKKAKMKIFQYDIVIQNLEYPVPYKFWKQNIKRVEGILILEFRAFQSMNIGLLALIVQLKSKKVEIQKAKSKFFPFFFKRKNSQFTTTKSN